MKKSKKNNKKQNTPSFVLTLSLNTIISDTSALNKYFELSRKIYNACLHECLKRFNLMRQSKEYQKAKNMISSSEKTKEFNRIEEKYGFKEYDIHKYVTKLRINEFKFIDTSICQKLATRAFNTVNKLRFGNAKKVNFISKNQLYSIEGKTNKQGIRFREIKGQYFICFNKLKIPVIIKKKDHYAKEALTHKIKYCRLKKLIIKGKEKYYIQLILEGLPPIKVDIETGEVKHYLGEDKIGIDIGTKTIAICSENEVKLLELAEGLTQNYKLKRILLRKMDRQRRANNPNKYNENGTIKKNNKTKWINSKNYLKTKSKHQDNSRKIATKREILHNKLANEILEIGNIIKVEMMNYKALQMRVKETKKDENGKFKNKKRFGKSLENKAPAKFLEILERKLKYQQRELLKINTYKIKASQYNPFMDKYIKKDLNERWNYFIINNEEIKIQRDLFSAFLIKNVINDEYLDKIDREKCLKEFDNFRKLHDIEVKRIKNSDNKILSSMGI